MPNIHTYNQPAHTKNAYSYKLESTKTWGVRLYRTSTRLRNAHPSVDSIVSYHSETEPLNPIQINQTHQDPSSVQQSHVISTQAEDPDLPSRTTGLSRSLRPLSRDIVCSVTSWEFQQMRWTQCGLVDEAYEILVFGNSLVWFTQASRRKIRIRSGSGLEASSFEEQTLFFSSRSRIIN